MDPAQCAPIKSRPYLSGPQIFFLHVSGQAVGGAQYDLLQQLPFPCNSFFIVSMTHLNNSVYLSLKPTNKSNLSGSAAVVVNGNEEWFSMNALQLASTDYWTVLRFKEKINQFFLSLGTETGAQSNLTIACVADDEVQITGGMWS